MNCGANAKRSGQPCRAPAMPNGRCHKHGGSTPSGSAHPSTRHGRYSKQLPTRLAARYEEARSDPELLALRDDIALLDTRLAGVVQALDTGESQEAWAVLGAAWKSFSDGWQDRPVDESEKMIGQIGEIIARGLSEGYVWNEIRGLLKDRAALVANDRQRLVQMQQMITAEQALVMLGAIVDTVRRHVRDRNTLAAISAELGKLALQPAR